MEGAASYDCSVDNLKATELRLGLPGTDNTSDRPARGVKRSNEEAGNESQEVAPVAKVQAVGWPPVRSYRKKAMSEADSGRMSVKVSMDGAPYLRKIDLKVYKGYKELREAIQDLFKGFSLGDLSGIEGCMDSDYAITYEDKDGDWMLVGDVPWGMFVSSCKRLRIMKGSEAKGLGCNQ